MLQLFRISVLKEYRNKYPSKWTWLGQIISEMALLFVYWYTAKAFVPNLEVFKTPTNYFSFIVIGEMTLFLPALFMTAFARILRAEVQQGTLEPSFFTKSSLSISWLAQAFAIAFVESFRLIFVLLLALFFFEFKMLSASSFLKITLLQLLAMPVFAGIGLITASIVMAFGRGERLLPMLTTAMTVLAGAYFPTQVLPGALAQVLGILSPMNILLDASRNVVSHGSEITAPALSLLILGVFLFGLGIFALKLSLKHYRHRSQPLLFLS